MKSLFYQDSTTEILNRFDALSRFSKPKWGKMDPAQMLAHCSAVLDIPMGKSHPKRQWFGLLIGKFVKPVCYNDQPFPRNAPAYPCVIISDRRNFKIEKPKLKQQIVTFQTNGEKKCITCLHPFFWGAHPHSVGKRNVQAYGPSPKTV